MSDEFFGEVHVSAVEYHINIMTFLANFDMYLGITRLDAGEEIAEYHVSQILASFPLAEKNENAGKMLERRGYIKYHVGTGLLTNRRPVLTDVTFDDPALGQINLVIEKNIQARLNSHNSASLDISNFVGISVNLWSFPESDLGRQFRMESLVASSSSIEFRLAKKDGSGPFKILLSHDEGLLTAKPTVRDRNSYFLKAFLSDGDCCLGEIVQPTGPRCDDGMTTPEPGEQLPPCSPCQKYPADPDDWLVIKYPEKHTGQGQYAIMQKKNTATFCPGEPKEKFATKEDATAYVKKKESESGNQ